MRIILKLAFLFYVSCLFATECYSQNYIGMHKDEIIATMKDSQKNFKLNTSYVNPHYNYLKYEDPINEVTILYFLSEEDKCKLIRKMYDYSNINDVEKELNENYTKVGKNKWEFRELLQKYSVELTEGDWFFTVTIKKK
jgi:hypothetical protein